MRVGLIAVPARRAPATRSWNGTTSRRQLIVVPALAPVQQTRAMAIVQIAVHDAINAITGEYQRYDRRSVRRRPALRQRRRQLRPPTRRSPESSVPRLSSPTVRSSLVTHSISVLDPGLAFGESVANRILALRENDGAALAAYIYLPADAGDVGVWTPVSAAPAAQSLLPGWGNVTPLVLQEWIAVPARSSSRARQRTLRAATTTKSSRSGASMNSTRQRNRQTLRCSGAPRRRRCWNPILRQAIETAQPGSVGYGTGHGALLSRGGRRQRRVLGREVLL